MQLPQLNSEPSIESSSILDHSDDGDNNDDEEVCCLNRNNNNLLNDTTSTISDNEPAEATVAMSSLSQFKEDLYDLSFPE